MRVLLFSTILYLLGIAVVLYLRPKLMFHADGRWREFGLHDDDMTVFPFWFFCIAWAVVSFLLGRLIVGEPASAGKIVSASLVAAAPSLTSRATEPIDPLPVLSSGAETNALSKPGYYKLNTNATKKNGVPRYIYVGPELPSEEDE